MEQIKRVAIFAHYDINNLIQDYVVYYLKELKKYVGNIIFVSDSIVEPKQLNKINNIVEHMIIEKHGEYDFGSYKRGFLYAKENNLLNECDELIFCNDSCYAPLYDFKEMFDSMSSKSLDFWGNTMSKKDLYFEYNPHVQSYFIVFSPNVFNSDAFNKLIFSVKKESSKNDIITNYEVGLSKILLEHNFKFDVYCNTSKNFEYSQLLKYKDLIQDDKSPFVKTSIYRNQQIEKKKIYPNYKIIKQNTKYDINLIREDIKYNLYKTVIRIKYEEFCMYLNRLFIVLKNCII